MRVILTILILFCLLSGRIIAQYSNPGIGIYDLIQKAEINPEIDLDAKNLAIKQGLPVSMSFHTVLIEARGIENGNVVYSVITDVNDIYGKGYSAFFGAIRQKYDLSKASINYGNGRITNLPDNRMRGTNYEKMTGNELIIVMDSQVNRGIAIDATTGNVIDSLFIPPQSSTIMNLPMHLLQLPNRQYLISDQNYDIVHKYDTTKLRLGVFAPSGGRDTTKLRNIRGMAFRPDNGNLLVCNYYGGDSSNVQEFNLNGNYSGKFINGKTANAVSPYCVIPVSTGYILTSSSGARVTRYNLSGNFTDTLGTVTHFQFPQQGILLPDGNLAICEFSLNTKYGMGLKVFTQNFQFVRILDSAQSLRGVARLNNGNFITSSAAGVFEVNGITGQRIRTLATGLCRFASRITLGSGGLLQANINFQNGWNLFSVPVIAQDMSVNTLLTGRTSSVYSYNATYQNVDTVTTGKGYWVKYGNNASVNIQGTIQSNKNININSGWNIIGPFENNVPVNQISTIPPNIISSQFFSFENGTGYIQSDTLKSGKGYFVKFNQNGMINIP